MERERERERIAHPTPSSNKAPHLMLAQFTVTLLSIGCNLLLLFAIPGSVLLCCPTATDDSSVSQVCNFLNEPLTRAREEAVTQSSMARERLWTTASFVLITPATTKQQQQQCTTMVYMSVEDTEEKRERERETLQTSTLERRSENNSKGSAKWPGSQAARRHLHNGLVCVCGNNKNKTPGQHIHTIAGQFGEW